MVRRPSRCLGIDTDEPELRQIQLVDEDVDHANRIILANPIFQAFRKERALSAVRAFNEALHQTPPRIRAGIITRESPRSERFYTAWVKTRIPLLRVVCQLWPAADKPPPEPCSVECQQAT